MAAEPHLRIMKILQNQEHASYSAWKLCRLKMLCNIINCRIHFGKPTYLVREEALFSEMKQNERTLFSEK